MKNIFFVHCSLISYIKNVKRKGNKISHSPPRFNLFLEADFAKKRRNIFLLRMLHALDFKSVSQNVRKSSQSNHTQKTNTHTVNIIYCVFKNCCSPSENNSGHSNNKIFFFKPVPLISCLFPV